MGEPWHLIQATKGQGVIALSSNYTLYADMSNRVMAILAELSPAIEVYSIDEAFVDATGIPDLSGFGQHVRSRIRQWTGLPVCVGFGSTKTRAKLANHVAKKQQACGGVFDLEAVPLDDQARLLASIDVAEVWGVGRRLAPQLAELGITSVLDLLNADSHRIRARFSVVLQRTVDELRGISCVPLGMVPPAQQQIMCSRSFGRSIEHVVELREAVLTYTARAAVKLRRQAQITGSLTVFVHTNALCFVIIFFLSIFRCQEPVFGWTRVDHRRLCARSGSSRPSASRGTAILKGSSVSGAFIGARRWA